VNFYDAFSQKQKIHIMAKWTRKQQEIENQKYFFNGGFFVTATIKEALSDEDILFIYTDVRQFAEEKNGIDYIQVYESDIGLTVWIIGVSPKFRGNSLYYWTYRSFPWSAF